MKSLLQLAATIHDKIQRKHIPTTIWGLETEQIKAVYVEWPKFGRKDQQCLSFQVFFFFFLLGMSVDHSNTKDYINKIMTKLRIKCSCEGKLYMSTWLDHGVPRYLARCYFQVCLWRCFQMRFTLEGIDWVKQIASPMLMGITF